MKIIFELPYGFKEKQWIDSEKYPVPRVGEHVSCVRETPLFGASRASYSKKLVVCDVDYCYEADEVYVTLSDE